MSETATPLLRWRSVSDPRPAGEPARVDLRLALPALTVWVVSAGIGLLPTVAGPAVCVLLAAGAVALAGWAVRSRPVRSRAQAGAAALLLLLASGAAAVTVHRAAIISGHPLTTEVGHRTGVGVTVTGFARPVAGGGVLLPVRVESLRSIGPVPGRFRTALLARGDRWAGLAPGTRLAVSVEILEPRDRGDAPALRALGPPRVTRDASPPGRFAAQARDRFAAVSARALPGDFGALLPSFVLGDERRVPETVREDFRASGLAHLSAVSGANVTYVVGGAMLAGSLLGLGRRTRTVLAGTILAGFVGLVGPEPAVLRAAGTGAVGVLALATDRGGRPVAALAAVVLAVTLLDPRTATGIGFSLSLVATLALVLCVRPCSSALVRWHCPRPVADVVSVCVVAHAATLPVLVASGLAISPWSLPANLAVAPAVPVVTVVGTAAAAVSLVWPGGSGLLARACGPPLWWLRTVAHVAAGLPGSPVRPR